MILTLRLLNLWGLLVFVDVPQVSFAAVPRMQLPIDHNQVNSPYHHSGHHVEPTSDLFFLKRACWRMMRILDGDNPTHLHRQVTDNGSIMVRLAGR